MAMFEQKKTWFSRLVSQSPVVIRFRGSVRDSQYDLGTNEDTGYDYRMRYFDARDDSTDGTYLVITSEAMEEVVESIPSDVWVKVTASREDGEDPLSWTAIEADERPVEGHGQQGQGYHTYPSLSARYRDCLAAARGIAEGVGIVQDDTPEIYWEFVRNVATHFSMSLPSEYGEPLTNPDQDLEEAEDDVSDIKSRISDLVEEIDDWSGTAHDGNDRSEMLERISTSRAEVTDRETLNSILVWLEKEADSQREVGGEELPF